MWSFTFNLFLKKELSKIFDTLLPVMFKYSPILNLLESVHLQADIHTPAKCQVLVSHRQQETIVLRQQEMNCFPRGKILQSVTTSKSWQSSCHWSNSFYSKEEFLSLSLFPPYLGLIILIQFLEVGETRVHKNHHLTQVTGNFLTCQTCLT